MPVHLRRSRRSSGSSSTWRPRSAETSSHPARRVTTARPASRSRTCATCATTGQFCTTRCRNNYVTATLDADGSRYAGTLFGYLYRSQDEQRAIEQGPAALVAASLASGEMQTCTVNTAWRRLVGRGMSAQESREVLPGLVQRFRASGHNYRALIREIVNAPAYRRID